MVSHNVNAPTEGVVHTENNVTVFYGEANQGKGTLYITTHILLWQNDTKNLRFSYPSISLHAISLGTERFPHECIYCLVDSEPEMESEQVEPELRDPEVPVLEVKFVPEINEHIKEMYDAITHCQELNPDPDEEHSEEDATVDMEGNFADGDGGIDMSGFYTAESNVDDIELSQEGIQVLQRLQENMRISSNGNGNEDIQPNGQFEDAEENKD